MVKEGQSERMRRMAQELKTPKTKIAFRIKDNFVQSSSSLNTLVNNNKNGDDCPLIPSVISEDKDEQNELRDDGMDSGTENDLNQKSNPGTPPQKSQIIEESSSLTTNVQGNTKKKKKRKHRSSSSHSTSTCCSVSENDDGDCQSKTRSSKKRRKVSKKSKKSRHHRHRSRKGDKSRGKKRKKRRTESKESSKEKVQNVARPGMSRSLVGCCYHSCDDEESSGDGHNEDNHQHSSGHAPGHIQLIIGNCDSLQDHQSGVNEPAPVDIISFQVGGDEDDEGDNTEKIPGPSNSMVAIKQCNGKLEINLNGGEDGDSYFSRSRSKSRSTSSSSVSSLSDHKYSFHSRSSSSIDSRSRSNSSNFPRRRSRTRSNSSRSDSGSRSSSNSSRSRSRSQTRSESRSKSRSRSRSTQRINPKDIPRRRGSPSFLDRRRITSARKRPISYKRKDPWPLSDSDSSF